MEALETGFLAAVRGAALTDFTLRAVFLATGGAGRRTPLGAAIFWAMDFAAVGFAATLFAVDARLTVAFGTAGFAVDTFGDFDGIFSSV